MDRKWTSSELSNYIQFFPTTQREEVLNVILESELLQRYLSTTEGRIMLGGVVDLIRDNTLQIVRMLFKGEEVEKMRNLAQQINVAYGIMYHLANIVNNAKVHEEAIKK